MREVWILRCVPACTIPVRAVRTCLLVGVWCAMDGFRDIICFVCCAAIRCCTVCRVLLRATCPLNIFMPHGNVLRDCLPVGLCMRIHMLLCSGDSASCA